MITNGICDIFIKIRESVTYVINRSILITNHSDTFTKQQKD